MEMIVDPGKVHVMQTKYVDFLVYIQSLCALQMTKKVVVKTNSSGIGSIGADFSDFFMQMSKYRLSIFYGDEP